VKFSGTFGDSQRFVADLEFLGLQGTPVHGDGNQLQMFAVQDQRRAREAYAGNAHLGRHLRRLGIEDKIQCDF